MMEELRPDILSGGVTPDNVEQVDNRVFAPTDSLDERSVRSEDFELDETLSGSGTGYDPEDPAEGDL